MAAAVGIEAARDTAVQWACRDAADKAGLHGFGSVRRTGEMDCGREDERRGETGTATATGARSSSGRARDSR